MLTIEPTVLNVDQTLAKIAMESGMLSNTVSTISNFFPNLLTSITSSFAKVEELKPIESKLSSEEKFVVEKSQPLLFLDLASIKIETPEGFKGQYADYATVLLMASIKISTIVDSILKPYMTYLAQFVSNKDAKKATKDNTGIYKSMKANRDQTMVTMDKYLTQGTGIHSVLGDVINRKQDLQSIYSTKSNIALQFKAINLNEVKGCVKQCTDMLEIIIRQTQDGEILNVTPEVTQNLALGAAEVAREVEYLSVLNYRVLTFTTCVDRMTEKLKTFIKA